MQINLQIAILCVIFVSSHKVNHFRIGGNLFSKGVIVFMFSQCLHLSCVPVQHGVSLILPQETSPSCASKNCLHLSRIPVQHGVSLILPQETSPSCASKNCLHLSRIPVQFSFSSCSVLVQYLVPRYCRSSVGVLSE